MGRLTDVAVKAATPGDKVRRMSDGEAGLYLVVLPDGGKGWRIDYTKPDGRRTTASLGTYPLVSLKEARAAAYEMRAAIKKGRDPIAEKKAEQEARKAEHERAAILRAGGVLPGTFEHAAGMYFEKMRGSWSVDYYEQARAKVDKYLLPSIGKKSSMISKCPRSMRRCACQLRPGGSRRQNGRSSTRVRFSSTREILAR